MKKLLLIIDVQRDFINEHTINVLDNIEKLINSEKYDLIAFTKFINTKDSIYYKKLHYTGCISQKQQEILIDTKNYKVFTKKIYTALNDELKEFIIKNNIDKIYLCGFDTDVCIQKTALDLFEQNYEVYILKDYCMSHKGKETHNFYINNMKRLIGNDKVI